MTLCTHCGRQNGRDARFCTAGGCRLDDGESCTLARLISLGELGTSYLVGEVERVIGRGPASDIVVDDPDLSARHARISHQDDGFRIEDLGSTNRTYVNGQPVRVQTLRHDDVLKLGRTFLRFEL